ncbi:hypothetical protein HDV00_009029 [Rhizophlyctis rosea]|nr:hypothetical protein HDV00_009029 [Rhizophlyctis rosea]
MVYETRSTKSKSKVVETVVEESVGADTASGSTAAAEPAPRVGDLESSGRDDAVGAEGMTVEGGEAGDVVQAGDEKEVRADGGGREGSAVMGSSVLGDVDREVVDFDELGGQNEKVAGAGEGGSAGSSDSDGSGGRIGSEDGNGEMSHLTVEEGGDHALSDANVIDAKAAHGHEPTTATPFITSTPTPATLHTTDLPVSTTNTSLEWKQDSVALPSHSTSADTKVGEKRARENEDSNRTESMSSNKRQKADTKAENAYQTSNLDVHTRTNPSIGSTSSSTMETTNPTAYAQPQPLSHGNYANGFEMSSTAMATTSQTSIGSITSDIGSASSSSSSFPLELQSLFESCGLPTPQSPASVALYNPTLRNVLMAPPQGRPRSPRLVRMPSGVGVGSSGGVVTGLGSLPQPLRLVAGPPAGAAGTGVGGTGFLAGGMEFGQMAGSYSMAAYMKSVGADGYMGSTILGLESQRRSSEVILGAPAPVVTPVPATVGSINGATAGSGSTITTTPFGAAAASTAQTMTTASPASTPQQQPVAAPPPLTTSDLTAAITKSEVAASQSGYAMNPNLHQTALSHQHSSQLHLYHQQQQPQYPLYTTPTETQTLHVPLQPNTKDFRPVDGPVTCRRRPFRAGDVVVVEGIDGKEYFGQVKEFWVAREGGGVEVGKEEDDDKYFVMIWLDPERERHRRVIEGKKLSVGEFEDDQHETLEAMACIKRVIEAPKDRKSKTQRHRSVSLSLAQQQRQNNVSGTAKTELDQLQQLALHPGVKSGQFIGMVAPMLSSHVELFLRLFGRTFMDWITWMHHSDLDRFTQYFIRVTKEEFFRAEHLAKGGDPLSFPKVEAQYLNDLMTLPNGVGRSARFALNLYGSYFMEGDGKSGRGVGEGLVGRVGGFLECARGFAGRWRPELFGWCPLQMYRTTEFYPFHLIQLGRIASLLPELSEGVPAQSLNDIGHLSARASAASSARAMMVDKHVPSPTPSPGVDSEMLAGQQARARRMSVGGRRMSLQVGGRGGVVGTLVPSGRWREVYGRGFPVEFFLGVNGNGGTGAEAGEGGDAATGNETGGGASMAGGEGVNQIGGGSSNGSSLLEGCVVYRHVEMLCCRVISRLMTDYLVTVLKDRSVRPDEMDGLVAGGAGTGKSGGDEELRRKAKVAAFVSWKVQDEVNRRRSEMVGSAGAAGAVGGGSVAGGGSPREGPASAAVV